MKTRILLALRQLAFAGAAALILSGIAPTAARAQTIYSTGASGSNGRSGSTGGDGTYNSNPGATGGRGTRGSIGGAGTVALTLSGDNSIIGGLYQGGNGGDGGQGGNGADGAAPVMTQFINSEQGAGGDGGPGGAGRVGSATIVAELGSTVSITGGKFYFGLGGAGGPGGMGGFGLPNGEEGAVGTPGANGFTLLNNGGTITLYGDFEGGSAVLTAGSGLFSGTLANEIDSQSFTYNILSGSIILVSTPIPEPSTAALLGIAACGLGFALRRQAARRK